MSKINTANYMENCFTDGIHIPCMRVTLYKEHASFTLLCGRYFPLVHNSCVPVTLLETKHIILQHVKLFLGLYIIVVR